MQQCWAIKIAAKPGRACPKIFDSSRPLPFLVALHSQMQLYMCMCELRTPFICLRVGMLDAAQFRNHVVRPMNFDTRVTCETS